MVCLTCTKNTPCSPTRATTEHEAQCAPCRSMAPGTPIRAIGSPFGALSPGHFADSIVSGVISSRWPGAVGKGGSGPLLTADIHSMPGMEGSPVFNSQNQLIALLLPPLLSRDFRAEVRSCLVRSQRVVLVVLFVFSSWAAPRPCMQGFFQDKADNLEHVTRTVCNFTSTSCICPPLVRHQHQACIPCATFSTAAVAIA